MKLKLIILFLLTCTIATQCAGPKKIVYNIPSYVPAERRPELMANLEKGRLLYKNNCSECHGIYTKGKDSIPNFTHTEILDYTAAFKANAKKNHAVMKKLLPEELSMITTFLQMRKIDSLPKHYH